MGIKIKNLEAKAKFYNVTTAAFADAYAAETKVMNDLAEIAKTANYDKLDEVLNLFVGSGNELRKCLVDTVNNFAEQAGEYIKEHDGKVLVADELVGEFSKASKATISYAAIEPFSAVPGQENYDVDTQAAQIEENLKSMLSILEPVLTTYAAQVNGEGVEDLQDEAIEAGKKLQDAFNGVIDTTTANSQKLDAFGISASAMQGAVANALEAVGVLKSTGLSKMGGSDVAIGGMEV